MSDLVKDTWIKGAMKNVIERIGRNAAKTIDTVIRNAVLTAGGLVQYAGKMLCLLGAMRKLRITIFSKYLGTPRLCIN
jgi:hypothetical protein